MTGLLALFITLSIANVIIQTIKSIATIKCGKMAAALVNAIAYGLYTVVLVYMNCELSLFAKVIVTALTNFIGVYAVKYFEEKARKDKLWKIEATFNNSVEGLDELGISHNCIAIDAAHSQVNFYCWTQEQSRVAREFIKAHNGKYFVSESKTL